VSVKFEWDTIEKYFEYDKRYFQFFSPEGGKAIFRRRVSSPNLGQPQNENRGCVASLPN
jgi:hypothetical protein